MRTFKYTQKWEDWYNEPLWSVNAYQHMANLVSTIIPIPPWLNPGLNILFYSILLGCTGS